MDDYTDNHSETAVTARLCSFHRGMLMKTARLEFGVRVSSAAVKILICLDLFGTLVMIVSTALF